MQGMADLLGRLYKFTALHGVSRPGQALPDELRVMVLVGNFKNLALPRRILRPVQRFPDHRVKPVRHLFQIIGGV